MAIQFNGSNQNLNGVSLVIDEPLTISGWFYRNDATAGELFTIGDDAPQNQRFKITVKAGGLVGYSSIDFTAAVVEAGGLAVVGEWNHVLVVNKRNNRRKIWLNGTGETLDTTNRSPAPTSVVSYAGVTGEGSFFNGRLAEWAVWSGTDTDDVDNYEAETLAAGFSPLCLTNGRILGKLIGPGAGLTNFGAPPLLFPGPPLEPDVEPVYFPKPPEKDRPPT